MDKPLIKVLIVDDEPIARDILESYLKDLPDFELAGKCKNALEAFKSINLQPIDLILLDINMPEISGMDLLRTLKTPPAVIFTTAYSEFAVESYELEVMDYLLKPISKERFLKALARVKASKKQISAANPLISASEAEPLMFVRSEGKWIKVDLNKLYFVEGLKDYIRLWTSEEKIIVHSTMKSFEEQLSSYPNFRRIHKSYIVNLDFISEADTNFVKVKEQQLSIGNTYKEEMAGFFNSKGYSSTRKKI